MSYVPLSFSAIFFCSVASRVINSPQKLNNDVLEVRRPEKESVKTTNKGSAAEKEARTVLVSGLPDGVSENNVFIHFQKKKNDGGEVVKVKMLGEGRAIVVFESPEGTSKCSVSKNQRILNMNLGPSSWPKTCCIIVLSSEKKTVHGLSTLFKIC
jgi:hypothetical protein